MQWQSGDTISFSGTESNEQLVFPGLFCYLGCGMGQYFARSGEIISCGEEEAVCLARREKISLVSIDYTDPPPSPSAN